MKEKLQESIANKLHRKYARQFREDPVWSWGKIREAVQGATQADKLEIIRAVEGVSIIRKTIMDVAEAEAAEMLANDSLDLDELKRILEDT